VRDTSALVPGTGTELNAIRIVAPPRPARTQHWVLYGMVFMSLRRPISLALIAVVLPAAFEAVQYLASNPRATASSIWQRYGARANTWMVSKQVGGWMAASHRLHQTTPCDVAAPIWVFLHFWLADLALFASALDVLQAQPVTTPSCLPWP
jgi:hypothetical protein